MRKKQVEREPMWDGNTDSDPEESGFSMVEREPMWDGNDQAQDLFQPSLELSENQCGMETPDTTSISGFR